MELIIKKAIDEGWKEHLITYDEITRIDTDSAKDDGHFYIHYIDGISNTSDMWTLSFYKIFLDPFFWQALGRAVNEPNNTWWKQTALCFHEINLTEGWDKAVAYLEDLIK